jgi:hypothetical protein
MSTDLVLLPSGPGTELPAIGAREVLKAWLDGRCRNTQRAYVRDIRHFANFVHARSPAAAIESLLAVGQAGANRVVLAYRAEMTRLDLSSATIARRLAALRSMVKVARLIGRVSWSIDVESHKVEPRLDRRGPNRVEMQKLWAAAVAAGDGPYARRDRAILAILSTTGLRRGELAALEVDDVLPDWYRPEALAVRGKGRRKGSLSRFPSWPAWPCHSTSSTVDTEKVRSSMAADWTPISARNGMIVHPLAERPSAGSFAAWPPPLACPRSARTVCATRARHSFSTLGTMFAG